MKKLIAAVLLVLLLACPGCKKPVMNNTAEHGTQPDIEEAAWQKKTERVILTLASMRQFEYVGDLPQWGDDPISREIINLTGVQINLIQGGDYDHLYMNSMAETLFLNHEKADIIVVDREDDITRLIASGEVWAIDELTEKYCPKFWDHFDPVELENNRSSDGHIYAVRSGYRNDAYYADDKLGIGLSRNMILKTDILRQMGKEMPTSVEGLEEILYEVQKHSEALGVDSPLRMTGALEGPVYEWMGLTQELVWNKEQRKIQTPYANERWLEYFKRMNQWYRDDILKMPEPVPGDEMMTSINMDNYMVRTEPTCFATAWSGMVRPLSSGSLYKLREGTEGHDTPFAYHLIQTPLKYQDKIQYTAADTALGDGFAVMLGKENDEERALLFLDFLLSEEAGRLTKWGIKDTHYTLSMQAELNVTEKYRDDGLGFRKEGVDYWDLLCDPVIAGKAKYSPEYTYTNSDYLALRKMQLDADRINKKYAAENRNPVLAFAPLSPDHGMYKRYQTIQALWKDTAYSMVTAGDEEEVEILWKEFQEEILMLGLAEIESIMTAQYLEALERYQKAGFFTEQ